MKILYDSAYRRAKNVLKGLFALVGLSIKRKSFPSRDLPDSTKTALSTRFKNFHLGCGGLVSDNFLNIDGNIKSFSKLVGVPVCVDQDRNRYLLAHDLRNGIPSASSALKIIYHSHFLEHLSNEQGMTFLSDCYRSLVEGGTMRFAVPDFELWCKNYVADDANYFNWYRTSYLEPWWETHGENALVFSGMLYNWEHKMAYDFRSLYARLSKIGFVDIERKDWGVSEQVHSLDFLEASNSGRKFESLVIECRKPPI